MITSHTQCQPDTAMRTPIAIACEEIIALKSRVEELTKALEQKPSFIRVGWFNSYNDYHGFQQVHRSYEGGKGTFPLFCRASDLAKTDLPASVVPLEGRGGAT